jgi:hypothetical protein
MNPGYLNFLDEIPLGYFRPENAYHGNGERVSYTDVRTGDVLFFQRGATIRVQSSGRRDLHLTYESSVGQLSLRASAVLGRRAQLKIQDLTIQNLGYRHRGNRCYLKIKLPSAKSSWRRMR